LYCPASLTILTFGAGVIDPWEGDSDSVTVDCQLISPPDKNIPRNALVTQFHVLLLYPDR
jgi:hypothetical protein